MMAKNFCKQCLVSDWWWSYPTKLHKKNRKTCCLAGEYTVEETNIKSGALSYLSILSRGICYTLTKCLSLGIWSLFAAALMNVSTDRSESSTSVIWSVYGKAVTVDCSLDRPVLGINTKFQELQATFLLVWAVLMSKDFRAWALCILCGSAWLRVEITKLDRAH